MPYEHILKGSQKSAKTFFFFYLLRQAANAFYHNQPAGLTLFVCRCVFLSVTISVDKGVWVSTKHQTLKQAFNKKKKQKKVFCFFFVCFILSAMHFVIPWKCQGIRSAALSSSTILKKEVPF